MDTHYALFPWITLWGLRLWNNLPETTRLNLNDKLTGLVIQLILPIVSEDVFISAVGSQLRVNLCLTALSINVLAYWLTWRIEKLLHSQGTTSRYLLRERLSGRRESSRLYSWRRTASLLCSLCNIHHTSTTMPTGIYMYLITQMGWIPPADTFVIITSIHIFSYGLHIDSADSAFHLPYRTENQYQPYAWARNNTNGDGECLAHSRDGLQRSSLAYELAATWRWLIFT